MDINALKAMLDKGQDNLLLRFGLGQAMLKDNQPLEAIIHLKKTVEFDPSYSAGWKLLGKAYVAADQKENAINAYQEGIRVAELKKDIQAVKEMKVFLKRLLKESSGN